MKSTPPKPRAAHRAWHYQRVRGEVERCRHAISV
jgi:hypothetical protein